MIVFVNHQKSYIQNLHGQKQNLIKRMWKKKKNKNKQKQKLKKVVLVKNYLNSLLKELLSWYLHFYYVFLYSLRIIILTLTKDLLMILLI